MSRIEIAGLTKRFGRTTVLTGVDLVVADGSTTAVLGASGSGKSTLLRLIAGFERADSGSIRIAERVVDGGRTFVRAQRRSIGYVPQDAALFPHLTVRSNIGFGLARHQRSRVDELVSMVGLEGLCERAAHQLSGGQQQRVALARALAIDPAVVLLDEPFGSLDAGLRETLRRDVASVLARIGATTILVTHDQNEALSFADQVAVLRDGQVSALGSPQSLYNHPPDAQTAAFIGDSNILDGQIVDGQLTCALGVVVPVSAVPDSGRSDSAVSGDRCQVLIRPEQIRLLAPGLSGRESPKAEIVDVAFHGHEVLARLSIAHHIVTARLAGDASVVAGEQVAIEVVGPVITWP